MNPKMINRIKNRYKKDDDLKTRLEKMHGQRDSMERWGYKKQAGLTNAGIIALAHIKKLNPILEVRKAEIRKLKAIRQLKKEIKAATS